MSTETPHQIRPVEAIFSCQVCNSPISEIYRDANSDKGFGDRDDRYPQKVTRLWLTECCHLTCGKHLEGGGVPLHPSGQLPEAPCPICTAEKNNTTKVKLFGIRGCRPGEYDKGIPDAYFNTPPIKLDSSGKGMEALRFQYLAFARFATVVFEKLRSTETSRKNLEERYRASANERSRLVEEWDKQTERIKQLEQSEKSLQHWKSREPKIMYYLDIFKSTVAQNDTLRQRLAALGEQLPPRPQGLSPQRANGIPDPPHEHDRGPSEPLKRTLTAVAEFEQGTNQLKVQPDTSSSRTLTGEPDVASHTHSPAQFQRPPDTSLRVGPGQSKSRSQDLQDSQHGTTSKDSRVLMPPPPIPAKRQRLEAETDSEESNRRDASSHGGTENHLTFASGPGGILLNNDGTWRAIQDIPKASVQHQIGNDSFNARQAQQPVAHIEDFRDNGHDDFLSVTTPRHLQKSATPRLLRPPGEPESYTPFRRQANDSVDHLESDQNFATHEHSEDREPYFMDVIPIAERDRYYPDPRINSNIYQRQSQRQRDPLAEVPSQSLNWRDRLATPSRWPPKARPYDANNYQYLRQSDMNSPFRTPLKEVFERPSRPESRLPQQLRTPSPTKRSINSLAQSAASPFFTNNAARSHTGRLTLPTRRETMSSIPRGMATPALKAQQYGGGYNNFTRAELQAPRTPRNPANGLFSRQSNFERNVGASPYVSQGPIGMRENIFAGQGGFQTPRHLTAQDFEPSAQRGLNIGPNGPSRMSIEGARRGGGLGDYLAADEGNSGLQPSLSGRNNAGNVRRVARR